MACWWGSPWSVVSQVPPEGTSRGRPSSAVLRAEWACRPGGARHAPSALRVSPARQWSPHLAHPACSLAKREPRAVWAGETTQPGSGVQDVTLALSPTADKEPVRQGPSEEGVPAEM